MKYRISQGSSGWFNTHAKNVRLGLISEKLDSLDTKSVRYGDSCKLVCL